MAKTPGHINAELLIKVQGADDPISIGNIAIPLKFVNGEEYRLAVNHRQVKDYVEQVYQNPRPEREES